MKIVSLQKKLRVIIVLLFILLVGVVSFIIYPTIRDILALEQEIHDTELFLESQYQRSLQISRQTIDTDEIASSTADLITLTVPVGSELEIIKKFESFASTYTIEQNLNVSYTDPSQSELSIGYYTFTFLNHGLFEDHISYLHALLSEPYVVHIDTIDMTRRNTLTDRVGQDVQSQVTLRFSAILYAK
jgi:hypothetical protein